MKTCKDCRRTKRLSEFHRNRSKSDGRQSWCKLCHNARARKWRRANPGYYKVRLARDPLYFRREKLRLRYGITVEQYDELHKRQKGLCAICSKPETRTCRGRRTPLAVDHCHRSRRVRGLLCHRCNTALHHLEDRAWLRRASAYLRRAT